jgi:nitric-oxide synthase, bacterial
VTARTFLAALRLGAVSYTNARNPLEQRLRRLSSLERKEEARAFLTLFYRESGKSIPAFQKRWAEVRRTLNRSGAYEHTEEELAYGCRVAWRNHGRCSGRLYWESLEVFDCRLMTEPEEVLDRMGQHMRETLGDGRIRSMASVFAPVRPNALPTYIESPQITQYAGYVQPDGTVLGDRQNIEATRIAISLGFRPPDPAGRFDLLPILLRDRSDRRSIGEIPRACIREVSIAHPEYPGIAELKLKWYAVPCVTSMIMTIGGIDYPCAPFSGFYVSTEIASRDLVDKNRYDLLPLIAAKLGYDRSRHGTALWRDKALTELNVAVLDSFRAAGVSMIDHHTASSHFTEFHQREQLCGRRVAADWRWIVPPQASAATDVFHLKMKNFHPVPNFYYSRADDGLRMMPFYGDYYRSRVAANYDRVVRRWKLWKRLPW